MKEFDKWWKKHSIEGLWDYEEYFEAGWEAALEWAKKECGVTCYGAWDVAEMIDKELENG